MGGHREVLWYGDVVTFCKEADGKSFEVCFEVNLSIQENRIMKVIIYILTLLIMDAAFTMKFLKSLSFVKKAKPVAATQLWEDLKEATKQVVCMSREN